MGVIGLRYVRSFIKPYVRYLRVSHLLANCCSIKRNSSCVAHLAFFVCMAVCVLCLSPALWHDWHNHLMDMDYHSLISSKLLVLKEKHCEAPHICSGIFHNLKH